MLKAIRPQTKELKAMRYVYSRYRMALKRKGLTQAKPEHIEYANTLLLMIDKITGQTRLFDTNSDNKPSKKRNTR